MCGDDLSYGDMFLTQWSAYFFSCRVKCTLHHPWQHCILLWPTLHLQVVQGELGICHVSPLRRTTPAGSWHVCRMSYDRLSARQGSATQRGQHSPSATAVYSHNSTGQTRGQQSTSPSCRDTERGKNKVKRHKCYCVCGFLCVNQLIWRLQLQLTRWFVATSLIREVLLIWTTYAHTHSQAVDQSRVLNKAQLWASRWRGDFVSSVSSLSLNEPVSPHYA